MSSTASNSGALWRLLWPHVRPQLPAFGGALTLALAIAGLSAAQPLLTRMVIDQGLIGREFPRLLLGCGGMLVLATLGFVAGGIHRFVYTRASGRTLFSLRRRVYEHLLRVSPRRLAGNAVGDLTSRLDGDIAEVQRFGTDAVASSVSNVLSLLTVSAVMLGLSWRLTLVVAGLIPLQLIVRHHFRPRIEATTRALRTSASRLSAFLIETLSGVRHVQSAGAERFESDRLEALGEEYLDRALRQQWVTYSTGAASALLGHAATAATFVIGGWYVFHGELTVGTLVAFAAYLGRSGGSAASLTGLYGGYHRARVSLGRVEELLALPPIPDAADALALPADARGALEFQAVTVRTPDGRALIDSVSLDIPAGSKILLRGLSGAGKSTLADCLRRFVDPSSGCITLDGRPLSQYRLADLRRRVVVVEHSPVLFGGSILDNLRYGHEECSEEAALAAARRAGADEFIAALPHGYATRVGEGGVGLSTGQCQRIAIARATLGQPLIVVLDEALSGLDVESTHALHDALDQAFCDRTRIVITHRDADVEHSDRQVHLEAGRIRSNTPGLA